MVRAQLRIHVRAFALCGVSLAATACVQGGGDDEAGSETTGSCATPDVVDCVDVRDDSLDAAQPVASCNSEDMAMAAINRTKTRPFGFHPSRAHPA
jgi:hypothetical protein